MFKHSLPALSRTAGAALPLLLLAASVPAGAERPVRIAVARGTEREKATKATLEHEQIHWHLREHDSEQRRALGELSRMYPGAPVGQPDGAESACSTWGHLVTCYLEIQAIRRLLGPERADAVIGRKRYYHWIYRTVLADEARIAGIVRGHRLRIE